MPFEDHSGKKPEKQPLGDKIRDLINPALADERAPEIQLKILDKNFDAIAKQFLEIMEDRLSDTFNDAARFNDPKIKNEFIITSLTFAPKGQPKYSPALALPLMISTAFTNFTAEEVNKLEGYIKLHMVAREENVALKLVNLLGEESKGSGNHQPVLIIDGSKTYEQGAAENYQLYPNLPPQVVKFDSKKPGSFDL
jgi:hypothetical protein